MNGNGRHNHYSLGKELGNIKQRLDILEHDNHILKLLQSKKYKKASGEYRKARRLMDKSYESRKKAMEILKNIEKSE